MTGEHGTRGSQGSADPPEHVRERGVPSEMQRRSYNEDAFVENGDEAERRRRAKDGAEEPAPGEADRLAEHEERGGDQRTSSL